MKFKIGDKVEVTQNTTTFPPQTYGTVGKVIRVNPGSTFPYDVEFGEGKRILYADWELRLATPPVPPVRSRPAPFEEEGEEATTQMTLLQKDGTRRSVTFVRVSIELFRSYLYPAVQLPNGTLQPAHIVRVDDPVWLYVAPSGSHRIADAKGFSHYIPAGWSHLWWKRKDGCPPFMK